METLISSQTNLECVPESYILPPERRPGNIAVPLFEAIPVIDLERFHGDRKGLIQEIIKASQEYGFFQLTSHGVSDELMKDVLMVGRELLELPAQEKAGLCFELGTDHQVLETCRLKASIDYGRESVHFWRDNLRHSCHPLPDYINYWPTNPPRYREVVGRYAVEVRKLSLRILDLISEGLGLESGYFEGELSKSQLLTMNYYPPCPDPTLVLGLPKHADPHIITLLNQGNIFGLQVLKDDQWLAVEPIPNAFVVNINNMLQIISNGKLKSSYHRVVTNLDVTRVTAASFIVPCPDSVIEPAKKLVNECDPARYKAVRFADFARNYLTDTTEGEEPLRNYIII